MFIVHIAGHLGKDPETRFTPDGRKLVTFTVATHQRKGKEEVTIWVRVTIWDDRFDKILPYLKKGSAVFVAGKMRPPSSWTDKEGRTQITLEIVAEMIDFSPFGRTDRSAEDQASTMSTGQPYQGGQVAYESHQPSAYDEGQSPMNQPSYGKSQGAFSGVQTGQASHHSQTINEDDLPF